LKAVRPHAGKEIRIVLDNLSTHTTPGRFGLAGEEPERHFPLHADRLVVAQPNRATRGRTSAAALAEGGRLMSMV
jgi:hypothetical protein